MNQNLNDVTYAQSDDKKTQATNSKIEARDKAQREILDLIHQGYAETSNKEAEVLEAQRQQQAEALKRNILSGAETNPMQVLSFGYDKIRESRSAQERGETYDENPTYIKPASNGSEVESLRSAIESLTQQMKGLAKG